MEGGFLWAYRAAQPERLTGVKLEGVAWPGTGGWDWSPQALGCPGGGWGSDSSQLQPWPALTIHLRVLGKYHHFQDVPWMTKAGKCRYKTSGRWDRKGNLKPYCTGNWMPGWKWRNGWWKPSKVRVAWFLEWGQRGVKGLPKATKVWRGSLFRYMVKVNSELDMLVVFNWSTEGTSGVLKGQRNRVSGDASALERVPPGRLVRTGAMRAALSLTWHHWWQQHTLERHLAEVQVKWTTQRWRAPTGQSVLLTLVHQAVLDPPGLESQFCHQYLGYFEHIQNLLEPLKPRPWIRGNKY